jgi:hypothetical protein
MAKLQDGSERIRIKVDVANKVREMATGLNMSFLEVLYYAVNTFYLHHYSEMRKFKAQPQTITPVEPKEEAISETLTPDSDDTCELELDI